MAEEAGIEPTLCESKSHVLPLDDSPIDVASPAGFEPATLTFVA